MDFSFFRHKTNEIHPSLPGRVYLDHASATPLIPEAWRVMETVFMASFGNPSAIHTEGQAARAIVSEARSRLAKTLEVPESGIVFTSGGTESNNLAIVGHLERVHEEGKVPYAEMEIITTPIEHPATARTLAALAKRGVVVHELPVSDTGQIKSQALRERLSSRTVLVTVSYVNSEIGSIERVGNIGRIVNEARSRGVSHLLFHLDAAQAPLWLPCVLSQLKVDLMSLDAGKCGGPKGMGVLAYRKGVALLPILYGGAQERGLRPGTENPALIAGGVEAILKAQAEWQSRAASVSRLRDWAMARIGSEIPRAVLNGPFGADRVANNINISIPGLDAEFMVVSLDEKGVAASTKSACSAAGGGMSQVVHAVTGDAARAQSTLRLTLGSATTEADMEYAISTLAKHVAAETKPL